MPLIIDEIVAEVDPAPRAVGTTDARPAQDARSDEILDLLELTAEREERLRVD